MLLERTITAFITFFGVVDALGSSTVNFFTNQNSAKLGVPQAPKAYSVKVVKRLPHPGTPWTQGFEWMQMGTKGLLVESSGDYPAGTGSFMRALSVDNAKEVIRVKAPQGLFVEGIAQRGNHWYVSTYTEHQILELDMNMTPVATHSYPSEGWGLTYDRTNDKFLATNSTALLAYIDPKTFQTVEVKEVTCMGKSVSGLNELEYVADFFGVPCIMGNIINTRLVLILNPTTAECIGTFHLEDLEYIDDTELEGFHVANGIAYDRSKGTYFITGKNWKHIYEMTLHKERLIGMHEADALLQAHLELAPVAAGSR